MLVGRAQAQREVEALLAGARLGQSGVLVVRGEAGIGKSALVEDAVARATGLRLLRACGSEAERELPFAGLAALLRPVLDQIETLPAPQAEALGVALALREGIAADRFAISAGVLTLLTRVGEERPTAVVVDDAHLLDRPSADALAFVARRLIADPLLVLVALRPDETDAWDGLPVLDLASPRRRHGPRGRPGLRSRPDGGADREDRRARRTATRWCCAPSPTVPTR